MTLFDVFQVVFVIFAIVFTVKQFRDTAKPVEPIVNRKHFGEPCGYQFDSASDNSVPDVRESESMSSARDWMGGSESPTRTNPRFSAN